VLGRDDLTQRVTQIAELAQFSGNAVPPLSLPSSLDSALACVAAPLRRSPDRRRRDRRIALAATPDNRGGSVDQCRQGLHLLSTAETRNFAALKAAQSSVGHELNVCEI